MTRSLTRSATVVAFAILALLLCAMACALPSKAYADMKAAGLAPCEDDCGCGDPTPEIPGQKVDKTLLDDAIRAAKDAQAGVRPSSEDGRDVGKNFFYVTPTERQAILDAVEAAEAVLANETATQAQVNVQTNAVKAAKDAFVSALKPGKKVLPAIKSIDIDVKSGSSMRQPASNGVYAWRITFQEGANLNVITDDDFQIQRKPYGKDWKNSKCPTALYEKKTGVVHGYGIPGNDEEGFNQWRFAYAGDVLVDCPVIIQIGLPVTITVDKGQLESAIKVAQDSQKGVKVSANGKDVDPKYKWTTAAQKQALTDAIAAAQAIVDKADATQVEVDLAVVDLSSAQSAFDAAKKAGVKVDPAKQVGQGGSPIGKGASSVAADKAITTSTSNEGPTGSKFATLMLRSTSQGTNSITLQWAKAKGAVKYIVYGNLSNKANKLKKISTLAKNQLIVRKAAGKALAKGKYYKFMVVALDKNNNVVSTSKMAHVATKGGKALNAAKVTTLAKKGAVALGKGKTFKLGAKQVSSKATKGVKGAKLNVLRKLSYETTNAKVATVSPAGLIRAKGAGTCFVYAYTQTGTFAKVKVTVK